MRLKLLRFAFCLAALTVNAWPISAGAQSAASGNSPVADVEYSRAYATAPLRPPLEAEQGSGPLTAFPNNILIPPFDAAGSIHPGGLFSSVVPYAAMSSRPMGRWSYVIALSGGEGSRGNVFLGGSQTSFGMASSSLIGGSNCADTEYGTFLTGGGPDPQGECFALLTVGTNHALIYHMFSQFDGESWEINWYDPSSNMSYEIDFSLDMAEQLGASDGLSPDHAVIAQSLAEAAGGFVVLRR